MKTDSKKSHGYFEKGITSKGDLAIWSLRKPLFKMDIFKISSLRKYIISRICLLQMPK